MKLKACLILGLVLLVSSWSRLVEASQTASKGTVTFEQGDRETRPVDPENPSQEVEPGGGVIATEGPLRLDFIPKFTFGAQAISAHDQTYFANAQLFHSGTPARANYVQVTDNRTTIAGWALTVKQEHQFSASGTNKTLKGAVLSLDHQWANSETVGGRPTMLKEAIEINQIGASYPIAIAEAGQGNGTWVIQFGSSGETDGVEKTLRPALNADGSVMTDPAIGNKPIYRNQAVSLFVPGKTLKEPVKYTTVLTWTIAELS